jgi:hypothetical protein
MTNRRVYSLLATFLIIFWGAVLSGAFKWLSPKERVYDCSNASFHPDVPKEVKAKCRKVRT